ncbi:MAG: PTS sugar transporter subunit IIA [Candidatus Theseobacter exili]|nr:PTS sugar transporter subunit IIA [Candidatus Theseobacter exili]
MIKLSGMLSEERCIDLMSSKKENALKELVFAISKAKQVNDRNEFYRAIMEREKIISTGIGIHIAVPHVKIPSVTDFVMAIGRKSEGIDYDSLDGKPVSIIIMIGANESQRDQYLKVLARIVLLFKNSQFRRKIINAKTSAAIIKAFADKEKESE